MTTRVFSAGTFFLERCLYQVKLSPTGVYKPEVGFNVDIKVVGAANATGKVVKVETHKDIVDTVYVQLSTGNATKLVIVNGRWQVNSYTADHKVFFTASDGSTDTDTVVEI